MKEEAAQNPKPGKKKCDACPQKKSNNLKHFGA
jgi:hypothetical protein